MPVEEHDIDVAISFKSEDANLASDIRSRLGKSLDTFVYTEKQEELAGTNGLETLRMVFRHRAKLVVSLFRSGWGETPWTRVEMEAISMCSQIQERIVPVGKGRGSSLAKPERGAIFGSFMCLILSPTVYL